MKLIMEKCPTDMCHASTLLKIGPDRFLAAWFGGTKEGNGDVAIWFTRGNEEHFEEPKILAQSEEAHWNPVLFRVDEKKIIIFYKVGNEISKWRTMYRVSEDNGETFGEEKELVPGDQGGRGPVRNKPIRLKSGRILAPGSTEQGIWKAFVDRSDDDGKTWNKSQEVEISLPLFRRKYNAQQRESENYWRASELKRDNVQNQLHTEYISTRQQLEDAARKLELYSRQYDLSLSTWRLIVREFSAGRQSLTDVIQVERQMLDYKLKKSEAVAAYNTSVAAIEKLISTSITLDDK